MGHRQSVTKPPAQKHCGVYLLYPPSRLDINQIRKIDLTAFDRRRYFPGEATWSTALILLASFAGYEFMFTNEYEPLRVRDLLDFVNNVPTYVAPSGPHAATNPV
jgi:hypothetical protein